MKQPERRSISILYSTEPSRIISCNGVLTNALAERVYCNTMFAFKHEKYKVTVANVSRKFHGVCVKINGN